MKSSKILAIIDTHQETKSSVDMLNDNGFDINHLSIVGKAYQTEEHAIGFYNIDNHVNSWGKTGGLWEGIWGNLVGSGMFWMPESGATLVAGPFVTKVVKAIEAATFTKSKTALGAALMSIGVPENSLIQYEVAIQENKYLVVLNVDVNEIERAQSLLSEHKVTYY